MTTRCPSCFQVLTNDRYAWRCSGVCAEEADGPASDYSAVAIVGRPVTTVAKPADPKSPASKNWPPRQPICQICATPTAVEVCPNCHWGPLPEDWRRAGTTCVAMAGARQTGKSFYVCVLVQQLSLWCEQRRTTLEFADASSRGTYQTHYEEPLLVQRGLIQPTGRAAVDGAYQRDPIILSLGMVDGRRHYVVLRDVAGEELEGDVSTARHLRFFAYADSVFFLFDPLGVPEIAAELRGLIGQESVGGDPRVVLSNVLHLIGQSNVRLAVILSKFDALESLRGSQTAWNKVMSNVGAAFLRDAGVGKGAYDEDDGALVHLETRSLLLKLHADALVLALENPSNGHRLPYRFFTVSVLGEIPRHKRIHGRGISPHRCLDPLKWTLRETLST
jgi:hypothetical protein